MNFSTRPHFEDRQIVQHNDESVRLSGITYIGSTILDFSGTTTGQTTVNISNLVGYLNEGREYGFVVEPPLLKISGSTGYTSVNVAGWVLTAVNSDGAVSWMPNMSADTNTYVTGGTLSGTNLILGWNNGGTASPVDLSALGDFLPMTGNTSGDCVNTLYVSNIYSCSPLHIEPSGSNDVYITENGGNVGIGTNTPTEKLTVNGNTYIGGTLTTTSQLTINQNDVALPIGSTIGDIEFFGYDGTGYTNSVAIIRAIAQEDFSGGTNGTSLQFRTTTIGDSGSNLKMLISGDGNVGIGTNTEPEEQLHVTRRTKSELGYYSNVGTSTDILYEDQWQRICEWSFSFSNNTQTNFTTNVNQRSLDKTIIASLHVDYGSISGSTQTSNINIINYGEDELLSDDVEIYINSATTTVTLYHKIKGNYSTPNYTHFGRLPFSFSNHNDFIGYSLSGETNDLLWATKNITNGFTSNSTNGNFGIGVTGSTQQLDVNNNARFRNIGSSASAGALHYTSDGTLTTNTSDYRLKTNIKPVTNALDKILNLKGVYYNWVEDISGDTRLGFIAQEVNSVIPELAFTNQRSPEQYMGVHYDNVTALLVEGIKELVEGIKELDLTTTPNPLKDIIKGSYIENNWGGLTTQIISNNNTSGYTSFLLGDLSEFPLKNSYGFLSYYGEEYNRNGTPNTGKDFYDNKLVLKSADDSNGLILSTSNNKPIWWEIGGDSKMVLNNDNLGIGLGFSGNELPTSNLQIGSVKNNATFKFIDGNQKNGKVLTSDNDGNATWQTINGFKHYLGESFEGGIIYHLWKDVNGEEHGLIVSPNNTTINQSWSNINNFGVGDGSRSSWDGFNNTKNIIKQEGHIDSAANLSLVDGWYLPAIDELLLLMTNRFIINKSLDGIGGTPISFIDIVYWSSTEFSDDDAMGVSSKTCLPNQYDKMLENCVRGIKSF